MLWNLSSSVMLFDLIWKWIIIFKNKREKNNDNNNIPIDQHRVIKAFSVPQGWKEILIVEQQ